MSFLTNKYRRQQAEVERLKQEQAQADAREPMFAVLGSMCTDVAGWIAEYARRFPRPVRAGEVRVIKMRVVDPPPCHDLPRPRRIQREQRRPAEAEPEALRPPATASPPADPHGYERMSIDQLYDAARQPMPGDQRRALETVLNRKKREQRQRKPNNFTPEEHERLWRMTH
jgi:hypothetical protein